MKKATLKFTYDQVENTYSVDDGKCTKTFPMSDYLDLETVIQGFKECKVVFKANISGISLEETNYFIESMIKSTTYIDISGCQHKTVKHVNSGGFVYNFKDCNIGSLFVYIIKNNGSGKGSKLQSVNTIIEAVHMKTLSAFSKGVNRGKFYVGERGNIYLEAMSI